MSDQTKPETDGKPTPFLRCGVALIPVFDTNLDPEFTAPFRETLDDLLNKLTTDTVRALLASLSNIGVQTSPIMPDEVHAIIDRYGLPELGGTTIHKYGDNKDVH